MIKKYAIPIIFFIFLINTASAIQHEYISLTVTPGEELNQVVSFSGAYSRLFATADASGNAALWVTPRRVDFGAIDPGEVIERDYTISVPGSQKPGYYELVWIYSCKYTDGTTCTAASDTVIRITVEGGESTQTYAGRDQKSLTVSQGEEMKDYLSFAARNDEYGLYAWAEASGNAAAWVTPQRIDFGVFDPGENINKDYTIRAPKDQRPGNYELIWKWGCGYKSGKACNPVTGITVLQITVDGNGRQVLNPASGSSDDSILIGIIVMFIVFIILFIIWIYVLVWVVRDANKRGDSGVFWGLLTFFLGIVGLIIYLMARTGGRIIPCNFCGKEKLESMAQCPHCNRSTASAFYRPAPAPMTTGYPVRPQKPEADVNELKKQKEKLEKINALLEKLDEKLALGEITEARYTQLREQYTDEAEKLKGMNYAN